MKKGTCILRNPSKVLLIYNPGHKLLRKFAPPFPPFNVGYVELLFAAVLQKLPNIEWGEGGPIAGHHF